MNRQNVQTNEREDDFEYEDERDEYRHNDQSHTWYEERYVFGD